MTIRVIPLLVSAAVFILICAAIHWAIAQEPPSDCYKGPPASAQQCPKDLPRGRVYTPVQGPPTNVYQDFGAADSPVRCREEQLRWEDENGCYQYCRLSQVCGT